MQIHTHCIRLTQHPNYPVYLFALKPKEVLEVASISHARRNDSGVLLGYQREQVRKHIADIRAYIDRTHVLFPNAIILAFDHGIDFVPNSDPAQSICTGNLKITRAAEQAPPGWIVDGQQRAVALSICENQALPIPVVAFVGADVAVQRDQFLRVNNARPLPRRLVTELLPNVDTHVSARFTHMRAPSVICDALNFRLESPFCGMIRRPSMPKTERAVVNDTSVIQMVRDRLTKPSGCLFSYYNLATGEVDLEPVLAQLIAYWTAVRATFPDAWGLHPRQSRLMHGAGIKSLGVLMDTILSPLPDRDMDLEEWAKVELTRIAPLCRWTHGSWDGLNGLAWNAIENTSKSVRLLSSHLKQEYTLAAHRM